MPDPRRAICPFCGIGELRPDPFLVRCSGCEGAMSRELFVTLRQIGALPESPDEHDHESHGTAPAPNSPEGPDT